jgi:hypothetical protein
MPYVKLSDSASVIPAFSSGAITGPKTTTPGIYRNVEFSPGGFAFVGTIGTYLERAERDRRQVYIQGL